MKYCPKCGAQLKDEAGFCNKCGATVTVKTTQKEEAAAQPKMQQENTGYETKPSEAYGGSQSEKGKKSGLIIALAVLAVLVIGGIAYFFISSGKENKESAKEEVAKTVEAKDETAAIQTSAKSAEETSAQIEAGSQNVQETTTETTAATPAKKVVRIEMTERIPVENGWKTSFIGVDAEGNEIWRNNTGVLPNTELDCADNIGLYNDIGYYYNNGLTAVDPQTGEVLWVAPVEGAGITFAVDQDENVYICGYYGSTLYKVDKKGKILFTSSFDGWSWPYKITVNGDTVNVEFDYPEEGLHKTFSSKDGSLIKSDTLSETSPVADYLVAWVCGCNDNISLRVLPDKKADRITYIPLYETVYVLEGAGNGFVKVLYHGMTGYCLAEYLSYEEYEPYTGIKMQVVNCSEFITLRNGPDTSYQEIIKIPLGSIVDYIQENKDFYLIGYNGYIGYGLKDYLKRIN